jgi:hypothetical protein
LRAGASPRKDDTAGNDQGEGLRGEERRWLRSRTDKETTMNLSILTGNLGADVKVKTSGDTTFAHLSLANNYRVKKANGEGWENRVNWTRVTAFGSLAESLRSLGKGSRIEVEGHQRQVDRSLADAVHLLRRRRGEEEDELVLPAAEVVLDRLGPARDAGVVGLPYLVRVSAS